jgi:hypothetical protein
MSKYLKILLENSGKMGAFLLGASSILILSQYPAPSGAESYSYVSLIMTCAFMLFWGMSNWTLPWEDES